MASTGTVAAAPIVRMFAKSGNGRWGARLRVRAGPNDRHQVCGFQPRYKLVLALQSYKHERRRIDGNSASEHR